MLLRDGMLHFLRNFVSVASLQAAAEARRLAPLLGGAGAAVLKERLKAARRGLETVSDDDILADAEAAPDII